MKTAMTRPTAAYALLARGSATASLPDKGLEMIGFGVVLGLPLKTVLEARLLEAPAFVIVVVGPSGVIVV